MENLKMSFEELLDKAINLLTVEEFDRFAKHVIERIKEIQE